MQTASREVDYGVSVASEITVGQFMRAWREYRGITSTQLAKLANIPTNYISALETEQIKAPTFDRLSLLAGKLGISVLDIQERRMPPTQADTEASPTSGGNAVGTPLGQKAIFSTEIERRLVNARLSESERQLVAKHLIRVADEMLDLVISSREAAQREVVRRDRNFKK